MKASGDEKHLFFLHGQTFFNESKRAKIFIHNFNEVTKQISRSFSFGIVVLPSTKLRAQSAPASSRTESSARVLRPPAPVVDTF